MSSTESRIRLGVVLMAVGFVAELVMLSGLVTEARPPAWTWFLLLLVGIGFAIIASTFRTSAKSRRRRTIEATGPAHRPFERE